MNRRGFIAALAVLPHALKGIVKLWAEPEPPTLFGLHYHTEVISGPWLGISRDTLILHPKQAEAYKELMGNDRSHDEIG